MCCKAPGLALGILDNTVLAAMARKRWLERHQNVEVALAVTGMQTQLFGWKHRDDFALAVAAVAQQQNADLVGTVAVLVATRTSRPLGQQAGIYARHQMCWCSGTRMMMEKGHPTAVPQAENELFQTPNFQTNEDCTVSHAMMANSDFGFR